MSKVVAPSLETQYVIKHTFKYNSDGTIDGLLKNNIGSLHKRNDGKHVILISMAHRGKNRKYRRSHLVWFLCKDVWPQLEIDHIDRDTLNDRIENLREVTASEQQQNKKNYKGYKGFAIEERKDKPRRYKFRVRDQSSGIELGSYVTREECEKVIDDYVEKMGEEYKWGESGEK